MATDPYRLQEGGLIDRSKPFTFRFDGRAIAAYPGDNIASALLAAGVRTVGRSFKYHRPRGIFSHGTGEPNALVTVGKENRATPNMKATEVQATPGLEVTSQNRWPSLDFDVMAVNDVVSPMLVAGFYYKTFMGPTRWAWPFFEAVIRRAAGLGKAPTGPDPDRYDRAYGFCRLLVIGAGPAGLTAALSAAEAGVKVMLVEATPRLGGHALSAGVSIAGRSGFEWVSTVETALRGHPNVEVLTETTAFGLYDQNQVGLIDRSGPVPRYWTVNAERIVLANGCIERPLVFADNDLPGVMLAGSAQRYLHEHAVIPGRRVVISALGDGAYSAAYDLAEAGVEVPVLLDAREEVPIALRQAVESVGVEVRTGAAVLASLGGRRITGASIGALSDTGSQEVACDAILTGGGWSADLSLSGGMGGAPRFDEDGHRFLVGEPGPSQDWTAAGGLTGTVNLVDAMASGRAAAVSCLQAAGVEALLPDLPSVEERLKLGSTAWSGGAVRAPRGRKGARCFVDLQHDVTSKDVALAVRENYRRPDHVKRYTTMGMATDQGRVAALNGLTLLAEARGEPLAEVGTLRPRPPAVPVPLGALAGPEVGLHFRPHRLTPMDQWHRDAGAEMMPVGAWWRPRIYPKSGESFEETYVREARLVRERVGIVDVSTLGKIDVVGPDSAEFLNRVYSNPMGKIPVGKARYGIMLREDGFVFDDGTVWRLEQDRFLMTTTTANAAAVLIHLERLLQTVWTDLRVVVASSTDQWAGIAIAGPRTKSVLAKALDSCSPALADIPMMGLAHGTIAGAPVMLARLSFSGELAFEVYTPSDHGTEVWKHLLRTGRDDGIGVYGMEALGTLRIEKGHVAGSELDGRTTAHDLGLAGMVSKKKPDYVGKVSAQRPALFDPNRLRLVGLISETDFPLRAGAHLIGKYDDRRHGVSEGHVTAGTFSPALDGYIALGLLKGGMDRIGQSVLVADPVRNTEGRARVVSPHFYDPDGEKLHG